FTAPTQFHGLHQPRLPVLSPAAGPGPLLRAALPGTHRAHRRVELRLLRMGEPDLGGDHVLRLQRRLLLRAGAAEAVGAAPLRSERATAGHRSGNSAHAPDEDD